MRCHSRFHEYLLERLERRGEEDVRALRIAHAHGLVAEGHDEEATHEFLRAHAVTEALATAERAIMPVIERVDFAIAERWLDRLATVASTAASPLTTAELMLALARDDIRRVVRIADQLEELGERDGLAASSEIAAWVMALGYMHVIRPDAVYAVLAAAQPGPVVDAVRYAGRVMADPPGEGKPVRPELTGGTVDAFVYIADWALGRFTELSEAPGSRWVEAVKAPWRITALRATGHTQHALELYQAAQAGGAALALTAFVGPEVLIDAGRSEEARRVIAQGRALAHATGSLAFAGMNAFAEAKLALRLDHDPAAARLALDRPGCQAARGYRLLDEIRDTWFGLALLLESDDTAALTHLQRAVDGMVGGDRILELATAAVYLAEAAWRAGDEEAADRAADLALKVARRQGSNHLLLQALADFPAVVSRQIDAQPGADSTWHELGRALISQGIVAAGAVRASVELREFGQRSIVVNSQQARARITKTYELLAYLATRRPPSAERHELLEALFDARADESSRSYLRQSVRDLRQILPDGGIVVEDGRVGVSDDVVINTESMRFEAQLAEAARLQGDERLSATLRAIAIFDQGDYLPGARSTWADQRQLQLTDLAIDGRYEAAELALVAGRYDQARTLAEQVLRGDPFREAAWRLAMRIADALGDEKGVMRAYHDCEQALAELDTAPSPSTRQLLERLRR
jgi:DNA-binding SARP family transcriptional activator